MVYEEFQGKIYELLSIIGKAISSPQRLKIIDLLRQSPQSVELLSKRANLSIANTSQHLKVLANAKLVEREKEGVYVTYHLASKGVSSFYDTVFQLAKLQFAEIDRLTDKIINEEFIFKMENADFLIEKILEGTMILVDVRPHEEYKSGHIKGAISIPLEELNENLQNLSKDQNFVIYCRGPHCLLSVEAVKILRGEGFSAMKLDQGLPEWKKQGLPVEISGD